MLFRFDLWNPRFAGVPWRIDPLSGSVIFEESLGVAFHEIDAAGLHNVQPMAGAFFCMSFLASPLLSLFVLVLLPDMVLISRS